MSKSIKHVSLAVVALSACIGLSQAALAANLTDADKNFMKDTAMAGMTEIKLGHVAEKNSKNKEVLDFAAKMVSDHTNASNNLKKVATDDKVALPADLDAKHKGLVDKLTALKGEKFDHDYMAQMAEDHKGVVDSIEAEQKVASGELKNFCDKTLPVVQGHLKMAQDWCKKGK